MRKLSALVLVTAMLGGCTALLVGGAVALAAVGTYVYANGDLESSEEASLDRIYDATLAAMDDLEFAVDRTTKDALQAVVVAERANGDDVTVELESTGDDTTDVKIRVGVVGDEEVSRRILGAIRDNL